MSRIVLFGVGTYYNKFKDICLQEDEIVGIIDNNPQLWGTRKDHVLILKPQDVTLLDYDYIIPLCTKAYEMKEQLLDLMVDEGNICYLEEYRARKMGHEIKIYSKEEKSKEDNRVRLLIVTTDLDYNGGSLAAVYAAKALQYKGYDVMIATPGGSDGFIKETVAGGIDVAVCLGLPFVTNTIERWIDQFDAVIVNVFQMLASACEISKRKPTLWWIHECNSKYEAHYEVTRKQYAQYANFEKRKNLKIVGVSSIAKNNFNEYYPGMIEDTLPYGIPDERGENSNFNNKGRVVFSVIGNMSVRKAQKLLLEAFFKLDRSRQEEAELWFIGSNTSAYGKEVKEMAKGMSNVKMLGIKSREEMGYLYEEIDVVVCCSLEETMSITMTEGMMQGKICLCTDAAGMADYIEDGVNGFVFQSGDSVQLAGQIERIITLGEREKDIRRNARETYEKYFSMDVFGDCLEKQLQDIKGDKR